MIFRRTTPGETEKAYAVLAARTHELMAQGTGQYTGLYPDLLEYQRRTMKGTNWLLEDGADLLGVVSLEAGQISEEWKTEYADTDHLWISSLFVNREFKNQNVGKQILLECKKEASARGLGAVLLDCYLDSNFLEAYYQNQGFQTIAKKVFVFPGRQFGAALMKA